jgi:hypothetical protein
MGRPDRRRLPPAARRIRLTSAACPTSRHRQLAPACPQAANVPAQCTVGALTAARTVQVPDLGGAASPSPRSKRRSEARPTAEVKEGG